MGTFNIASDGFMAVALFLSFRAMLIFPIEKSQILSYKIAPIDEEFLDFCFYFPCKIYVFCVVDGCFRKAEISKTKWYHDE